MADTRSEKASEIEAIRKSLDKAEAELEAMPQAGSLEELVNVIHAAQCHSNHTDGCGWYYEFKDKKPNWEGPTHKRYLEIAERVASIVDPLIAIQVVEALR